MPPSATSVYWLMSIEMMINLSFLMKFKVNLTIFINIKLKIVIECIKQRSALFIPLIEQIRPNINDNNNNNNNNTEVENYKKLYKIMLFILGSCKSECSQFSINYEETQENLTIYFCKGSKNGCAKNDKIWGTGFYTGDSNLCVAARHSGVIDENGGICILEEKSGMSSYKGTVQNGIQSNNYGPYKKTIYLKSLLK